MGEVGDRAMVGVRYSSVMVVVGRWLEDGRSSEPYVFP
jgi:hypothetical protein